VFVRDGHLFNVPHSPDNEWGSGWRSSGFQVNPRFNIQDKFHTFPIEGHATPEGTRRYSQRNTEAVNAVNFSEVKNMTDEPLVLSKLIYGAENGEINQFGDLDQYNAMKYSVLSGGVNHLDTSH